MRKLNGEKTKLAREDTSMERDGLGSDNDQGQLYGSSKFDWRFNLESADNPKKWPVSKWPILPIMWEKIIFFFVLSKIM